MATKIFSCETSELKSAVSSVSHFNDQKSRNRLDQKILIQTLTVEDQRQLRIQGQSHGSRGMCAIVRADIEMDILKLVDAKRFKEILASSPDMYITFFLEDTEDKLLLRSGSMNVYLPIENIDNFPVINFNSEGFKFRIESRELAYMLRKTIFAWDKKRPGVFSCGALEIEGSRVTLAISDTHMLAVAKSELIEPVSEPGKHTFVIPCDILENLMREEQFSKKFLKSYTSEVRFIFREDEFNIEFDDRIIRVYREFKTYPEFDSVIPQNQDTMVTVNRKAFLSSMTRCFKANRNQMILNVEVGEIWVQTFANSEDNLLVNEAIPIKFTGHPVNMLINPLHLKEVIKASESDFITLGFTEADKPVRVYDPDDPDYIYAATPFKRHY